MLSQLSAPATTVAVVPSSWWHALVVGTGGSHRTRHGNPACCQAVTASTMETTPVRITRILATSEGKSKANDDRVSKRRKASGLMCPLAKPKYARGISRPADEFSAVIASCCGNYAGRLPTPSRQQICNHLGRNRGGANHQIIYGIGLYSRIRWLCACGRLLSSLS
jgi:hypothetical protein